ncbi:MAG TPA: hypothetical protein VH419_06305 [Nocardioidaceae bacterium]
MKLTTPCEQGACLSLETPCDTNACICLTGPPNSLVLTSNQSTGSVVVTADEVRQFAAAVQAGFFDELLGGGLDG